MEPLMSPAEDAPESKSSKGPERVTLGEVEVQKIDTWLKQLQAATRGFLTLTRSDLVRFLVRVHRDELGTSEVKQLRSDHYDPIRHIQWITPQIKVALALGDIARVGELQEELRGVELSAIKIDAKASGQPHDTASAKKRTPRKRKEDGTPNESEMTTCIAEKGQIQL